MCFATTLEDLLTVYEAEDDHDLVQDSLQLLLCRLLVSSS